MKTQIIEAKNHHCGIMARRLRASHHAILLGMHQDVHRSMRAAFDASVFVRSWLIDGNIEAVGGVTGTLASATGAIWLALTDVATSHPIAVVREARRQLEHIFETYTSLTTGVLALDNPAIAFARYLGFNDYGEPIDGLLFMRLNREDF